LVVGSNPTSGAILLNYVIVPLWQTRTFIAVVSDI